MKAKMAKADMSNAVEIESHDRPVTERSLDGHRSVESNISFAYNKGAYRGGV